MVSGRYFRIDYLGTPSAAANHILNGPSASIVRPRLRVRTLRDGLAVLSPVVQDVRDVRHGDRLVGEAQRQIVVLRSVEFAPESADLGHLLTGSDPQMAHLPAVGM